MRALLVVCLLALAGCASDPAPTEDSGGDTGTDSPTATQPPSARDPVTHRISIQGFAFDSDDLTIQVGDTVTWTNKDQSPHTVTSDGDGPMDSDRLGFDEEYSVVFDEAGTFPYHCDVHPSMTATVMVEP